MSVLLTPAPHCCPWGSLRGVDCPGNRKSPDQQTLAKEDLKAWAESTSNRLFSPFRKEDLPLSLQPLPLEPGPWVGGRRPKHPMRVPSGDKAGGTSCSEQARKEKVLSPKPKIANGAWGLCSQVQMSQMCQVLKPDSSGSWDRQSPLENSLLLDQLSFGTLCLLSRHLSQGWAMWCGLSWQSLSQLPICPSFGVQRLRKTKLGGRRKEGGRCSQRSLPTQLLPSAIQSVQIQPWALPPASPAPLV